MKESEIKIWTRDRCCNTYNLGRFGRNSDGGEEVDERRNEDTRKGLEAQLRKGTNDREGNNGIPETGRNQIFEGCTKRKEKLDCVNETVCISVPKPKKGMYFE